MFRFVIDLADPSPAHTASIYKCVREVRFMKMHAVVEVSVCTHSSLLQLIWQRAKKHGARRLKINFCN